MLFIGAPLSLIPALVFLPALLYLVVTPKFPHAAAASLAIFPALLVSEILGLARLVHCLAPSRFDLITALAVGTLMVLLVIAVYTGLFLAALAAGI